MARFLVTGGCGFIGSHLVESIIADGHDVRALDNLSTGRRKNLPPNVDLVVGDIADAPLVAKCMSDVDGCFHLAAVASVPRSMEAWTETHRTNLSGTIVVLDAARRRGQRPVPVVLASSAAVYGNAATRPLSETDHAKPLTPYGADKLGCELHGRVAANVFSVPTTALRFFNVYGPRQDPNSPYTGVIGIFCQLLASGRPVTIFGDGLQCRDFIYVSDVVRFLRRAMVESKEPKFNVFNVCTGKPNTILDLLSALEVASSNKFKVAFSAGRPGDIRESVGNPTKAAAALGISAETDLLAGLRALWLNKIM